MRNNWLPTTKEEVLSRGWDELDVIIVSGDAYVDHPSFGHAVIGRVLENLGLRVAILPQPNWRDDLRDFKKLGKPRLFFGITSGCMDSMVNHYTANKRLRSNDDYTPGGKPGFRPDYAINTYSNILKDLYPDTAVIIGGVEASLRRFTHYDYWKDALLPSILVSSRADMLVYGSGERPIVEIAKLMHKGVPIENITNIRQTIFSVTDDKLKSIHTPFGDNVIYMPSHEECVNDKKRFAKSFTIFELESNKKEAAFLVQYCNGKAIVAMPPISDYETDEVDRYYDLPFTRLPHPKYAKRGEIAAYTMIRDSITAHRGCFGGCSFCSISAHQGKTIVSRSEKSILKEVDKIASLPDFKGYISDIGGASANMYQMTGKDQILCKKCSRPSCIFPNHCINLNSNHKALTELLKKASSHPKVKKITIGSGVRYDLIINSPYKTEAADYERQLVINHVSGRLKVAPEHTDIKVTQLMRKPNFNMFNTFKRRFETICHNANLNQKIVPYFISSHPGCTVDKMAMLAIETKKLDFQLEQVQDFTPTPMTLSSTIYYCEFDPYTSEPIYCAKTRDEKLDQKEMFFWYNKDYHNNILNALLRIKREDLAKALLPARVTDHLNVGNKSKIKRKRK